MAWGFHPKANKAHWFVQDRPGYKAYALCRTALKDEGVFYPTEPVRDDRKCGQCSLRSQVRSQPR